MKQETFRLRLRLYFGNLLMLGPGKAELLAAVRDRGSISAAGRDLGMSYKRAWMLIEEMNAAFKEPVVQSSRGGSGGGGAQLTEVGAEVLAQYSALVEKVGELGAPEIAALTALLRKEEGQP